MTHLAQRRILPAVTASILWIAAPVLAQGDSTLDSAERLIRRAVVTLKDSPLSQSQDAGQILTALRSAKDPELLPVFEKLQKSNVLDNRIYGMVACALLTKDPARVDLKLLFSGKDQSLIGSAIASLIDQEVLSNEQLVAILKDGPDGAHKAMAAGELSRRKQMPDRAALSELLKDDKDVVQYYAAVTLLNSTEAGEVSAAQAALKKLAAKHDLRMAPVQALMLVRVQKEGMATAGAWAAQLAADPDTDEGLRLTAVSTLLSLKNPEGVRVLADMIAQQRDTIQQVKLGLISLEYAPQMKPAMLEPLTKSKSALAKTIGQLAQKGAEGVDNTAGLVALLKEGHPIVLDWALAYTDRAEGARRLAIRTALVNQATIVDNTRDRDYERAALAAQKILDEDGAPGRATIVELLKSDNRAVVEAVLAGLYRSRTNNQAALVMPVWAGLIKASNAGNAADFAALILARDGKKESLVWLPGMVVGGTAQGGGQGLRALAAWHYAKLNGQTAELLKNVLAD